MRGMDECQCHFCKQHIKMYTHHHKVKSIYIHLLFYFQIKLIAVLDRNGIRCLVKRKMFMVTLAVTRDRSVSFTST